MVTAYEAHLFLHLLGAVVWVGGATAMQAYAFLAERSRDSLKIAGFAKDSETIGMRVLMPASLLTLIFGFALMAEGGLAYDQFWVIFGLAVFAASFLAGMGFFGPESGRIAKLTAQHGATHPEVQARIRRIFLLSRIELVLLVAVVFDMVAKPSF